MLPNSKLMEQTTCFESACCMSSLSGNSQLYEYLYHLCHCYVPGQMLCLLQNDSARRRRSNIGAMLFKTRHVMLASLLCALLLMTTDDNQPLDHSDHFQLILTHLAILPSSAPMEQTTHPKDAQQFLHELPQRQFTNIRFSFSYMLLLCVWPDTDG